MQRSSSFFWDCDSNPDDDNDIDNAITQAAINAAKNELDPSTNELTESTQELSEEDYDEVYYGSDHNENYTINIGNEDEEETCYKEKEELKLTSENSFLKKLQSFRNIAISGHNVVAEEKKPLMMISSNTHEENFQKNMKNYRALSSRRNLEEEKNVIRFQVVVWHIGPVDVKLGLVPVRFRVTLFWNDIIDYEQPEETSQKHKSIPEATNWVMQGRRKATKVERRLSKTEEIDVPALSIINAESFEIIGSPEVSRVREDTRLMRWTCLYTAVLCQDDMRVENFPHDKHEITIKLAILADRKKGKRWDNEIWRLNLASEADSQGTTRVPYGVLVDSVTIPDFKLDSHDLNFEFVPFKLGSHDDTCLQVKLPVFRESGHYDMNILPLMVILNLVAISCLTRNFASSTSSTDLVLSIAFVQIGIRLSIDSRLPSVGYQIKLQRILNQCFWLLLFLVLESNVVYFLYDQLEWSMETVLKVDAASAFLGLLHTFYVIAVYYNDLLMKNILDAFELDYLKYDKKKSIKQFKL